MVTPHKPIKSLFLKEVQIYSTFSYQNFHKKRFSIFPKLQIQLSDHNVSRFADRKNSNKTKLLRIFKKAKFVRNLDLGQVYFSDQNFCFSALLLIAKKMSTTPRLSVYDSKEYQNELKGLFTTLPKYMKHLKSLHYQLSFESLIHVQLFHDGDTEIKLPPKIKFITDFLKYLPRLEGLKMILPSYHYTSYLNHLWRLGKYPASIQKLSFLFANVDGDVPKISFAHLKNLRHFEISPNYQSLDILMQNLIHLLLQVSHLESLTISFLDDFYIDASICESLKTLKGLEKLKLHFSSLTHNNNLQLLTSFEGCPLKYLNMRIKINSNQDIPSITNFLKKNTSIETLKLKLMKPESFGSSKDMDELIYSINNLPKLMNLSLSALPNQYFHDKKPILSNLNNHFKNLLSPLRVPPVKQFQISLHQSYISKTDLFPLLESLKGISSTLEKLQIDAGGFSPRDEVETDTMIEFIRSLRNIRSLRIPSLFVFSKKFFFEFIEAISILKNLRTLFIGEISGNIPASLFLEGIQKIISKHGLRKFSCLSALDFRNYFSSPDASPRLKMSDIRKKNPYLQRGPYQPIFSIDFDNW